MISEGTRIGLGTHCQVISIDGKNLLHSWWFMLWKTVTHVSLRRSSIIINTWCHIYLHTHIYIYIYIMYNVLVHAVLCFMVQQCSVHSLCDPHWLSTRHAYAASVMFVYVSNMSDLEMVTLGSFSWIGPPCLWLNRLRTWRLAEVEKGEVLKFWCQWLFPQ